LGSQENNFLESPHLEAVKRWGSAGGPRAGIRRWEIERESLSFNLLTLRFHSFPGSSPRRTDAAGIGAGRGSILPVGRSIFLGTERKKTPAKTWDKSDSTGGCFPARSRWEHMIAVGLVVL
jgi:hypothetical protein